MQKGSVISRSVLTSSPVLGNPCTCVMPAGAHGLGQVQVVWGRSQGLTGRPCWDRHTKKHGFASY